MVFRVSKGNTFTIVEDREAQENQQEEIIDPKSVVFLDFFNFFNLMNFFFK